MSHCGITLILYFTLWDNPNPLLVATRGGKTSTQGHKLVGARVLPPSFQTNPIPILRLNRGGLIRMTSPRSARSSPKGLERRFAPRVLLRARYKIPTRFAPRALQNQRQKSGHARFARRAIQNPNAFCSACVTKSKSISLRTRYKIPTFRSTHVTKSQRQKSGHETPNTTTCEIFGLL